MNIFFDVDETLLKQWRVKSAGPECFGFVTEGLPFEKACKVVDEFVAWKKTTPFHDIAKKAKEAGWTMFESFGEDWVAKARPGMPQLIERLKAAGHTIFIHSSGHPQHQNRALSAAGMHHVGPVFGCDTNPPPKQEGPFLLVDDGSFNKLHYLLEGWPEWIEYEEEEERGRMADPFFVRVRPYTGRQDQDTVERIEKEILKRVR